MKKIKLKDLEFQMSIPSAKIHDQITRVAAEINADYQGREVIFLGILNGSFMFASDLLKQITVSSRISFVKIATYQGTQSSGKTKELIGLNEELADKHVIVIEDIVDTGHTLAQILPQIEAQKPASLRLATLLFKPEACKVPTTIDYLAFSIPNDFIVGYGLDYDGYGRNLPDIYTVIED